MWKIVTIQTGEEIAMLPVFPVERFFMSLRVYRAVCTCHVIFIFIFFDTIYYIIWLPNRFGSLLINRPLFCIHTIPVVSDGILHSKQRTRALDTDCKLLLTFWIVIQWWIVIINKRTGYSHHWKCIKRMKW